MGKRGPKPLPPHKRRTTELRVRLTEAEYKQLAAKARAFGLTVSDYVRARILG